MKRKIIGIAVAVVLAVIGTLALVAYVEDAKDEAVKPEEQVSVFVVTDTIRQGATLAEIRSAVTLTELPVRLRAVDAVTDLADIDQALVAGVELLPGEQLLESRLVDSASLVRVEVPVGLQELTLALAPERAVGANLEAGDLVGVVLSFEPFDIGVAVTADTVAGSTPDQPEGAAKTPNTTHLTLSNILVTGVQYSQEDSQRVSQTQSIGADEETDDTALPVSVEEAPAQQLLITLAVSSPEVEQIVFAAEFGLIYLTGQNADTDLEGTRIVTLSQVYIPVPR